MTDAPLPGKSHGRKSITASLKPRDLMEERATLARAFQAQVITLFPGAFPGVLGESLTGKALNEANHINNSLLVLGSVIKSLAAASTGVSHDTRRNSNSTSNVAVPAARITKIKKTGKSRIREIIGRVSEKIDGDLKQTLHLGHIGGHRKQRDHITFVNA